MCSFIYSLLFTRNTFPILDILSLFQPIQFFFGLVVEQRWTNRGK